MKKVKFINLVFSVSLLFLLSITSPPTINAVEKGKNNETTFKLKNADTTELPNLVVIDDEEDIGSRAIICCYYNKKFDKKHSTEWTSYKRISDNVKTGNSTATITANKTVTISSSISGSATWADVGASSSISSSKSYSMTVPKKTNAYLAYRVQYKVEKGKKCRAHVLSKKCDGASTSYTIKRPDHGEYSLRKN